MTKYSKKNPPGTPNAKRRKEIAQRRKKILAMRLAGATLAEIGEAVGLDKSTVSHDINTALADIPRAEANQLRQQEVHRLDRLQRAVWTSALSGDLPAMDRVIRIIDRRAKLLGLDAPQQVEISAGNVDLDATVSKLLAVAGMVNEVNAHGLAGDGDENGGDADGGQWA